MSSLPPLFGQASSCLTRMNDIRDTLLLRGSIIPPQARLLQLAFYLRILDLRLTLLFIDDHTPTTLHNLLHKRKLEIDHLGCAADCLSSPVSLIPSVPRSSSALGYSSVPPFDLQPVSSQILSSFRCAFSNVL